jgi:hypothetical protein
MEDDMQRRTLPSLADQDVVVVAAGFAWEEYQGHNAYVCKVGRTFRKAQYMAFYSANQIYPLVPVILNIYPAVILEQSRYSGELGEVVDKSIGAHDRLEGETYQVVFLSEPDDPRTQKLDHPIPNDSKSRSGGGTAFTQYQRYVSLARLKRAKTTSNLVGDA